MRGGAGGACLCCQHVLATCRWQQQQKKKRAFCGFLCNKQKENNIEKKKHLQLQISKTQTRRCCAVAAQSRLPAASHEMAICFCCCALCPAAARVHLKLQHLQLVAATNNCDLMLRLAHTYRYESSRSLTLFQMTNVTRSKSSKKAQKL